MGLCLLEFGKVLHVLVIDREFLNEFLSYYWFFRNLNFGVFVFFYDFYRGFINFSFLDLIRLNFCFQNFFVLRGFWYRFSLLLLDDFFLFLLIFRNYLIVLFFIFLVFRTFFAFLFLFLFGLCFFRRIFIVSLQHVGKVLIILSIDCFQILLDQLVLSDFFVFAESLIYGFTRLEFNISQNLALRIVNVSQFLKLGHEEVLRPQRSLLASLFIICTRIDSYELFISFVL